MEQHLNMERWVTPPFPRGSLAEILKYIEASIFLAKILHSYFVDILNR